MAREIVIFINGILTNPGNAFAWTDNAVRWFNKRASGRVSPDKFEYKSPALLRRLYIDGHVRDLAKTISDYAMDSEPGERLHLVGHSNGCELIARAVQLSSARFASIHLIAGAVEPDFVKNGLGPRLERGQIGAVFCYCSRGDYILRYASKASQLATLGLLGYGDLGCKGPKNVGSPVLNRVETFWAEETVGHSDWFAPAHFDDTMKRIQTNLYAA